MILRQTRTAARAGFTLTELMIVVAIILVLAGLAVPITMNALTDAKVGTSRAAVKSILVPAVIRYKLKHDEFPSNLQELVSDGQIKSDQLLDPWKQPYQYTPTTQHGSEDGFDVWSNGVPGKGQPIGNWPQ
jgi:general secretion pathway protein G